MQKIQTNKNQLIGTIPVTVRNPQRQIKPVKDENPIEVGTTADTYFEVLKVYKDGFFCVDMLK